MLNVSEQIVKDLIDQGVNTFFGVQGGACARIIENVVKYKGKFLPVLNEQTAGFYAHGYHLATNKTAGLIFTTGPGLTNGLSGIAACYYDRIPLVTLVGQVNSKLNIAKSTNTRMVGFQEVPHLELSRPISDNCLKINNNSKYFKIRNSFLNSLDTKVQVVEILDDVQRLIIKKKVSRFSKNKIKPKKIENNNFLQQIKKSKNPMVILGSGFSRSNENTSILKILEKTNIPFAITWGGQKIQKNISKNSNYLGLMGTHNPGIANNYLKKTDLLITLGCSLLQHQIGKKQINFAPKSKIIFVNNDLSECKRAKFQFGNRLSFSNANSDDFVKSFFKKIKIKNFESLIINQNSKTQAVIFLQKIFKNIKKDSLIFSDAGATLSWTYQAANNLRNCPPIFTAFNLHSMGYANCAAVGAAISKQKDIYCVIGDGSLPMNCQELAWLKKYPVKIIIIDNKGYGIIRQTQRQFYKSKFYASDFSNKQSSLPSFSLEKILSSYGIESRRLKKNIQKKDLNWLSLSNKSKALILNVSYKDQVDY
jgi:acetolactate synthase-1/2/3 large subunit